MSHDRGWRAACDSTMWSLGIHFESHEIARGVTAMVVGSGALLGLFWMRKKARRQNWCIRIPENRNQTEAMVSERPAAILSFDEACPILVCDLEEWFMCRPIPQLSKSLKVLEEAIIKGPDFMKNE